MPPARRPDVDRSPSAQMLRRMGLAGISDEEAQALGETLRWAAEQRELQAQRSVTAAVERREARARRFNLLYAVAATVLGAVGSWLASILIGFHS